MLSLKLLTVLWGKNMPRDEGACHPIDGHQNHSSVAPLALLESVMTCTEGKAGCCFSPQSLMHLPCILL